jgi:hypothetical protein
MILLNEGNFVREPEGGRPPIFQDDLKPFSYMYCNLVFPKLQDILWQEIQKAFGEEFLSRLSLAET